MEYGIISDIISDVNRFLPFHPFHINRQTRFIYDFNITQSHKKQLLKYNLRF